MADVTDVAVLVLGCLATCAVAPEEYWGLCLLIWVVLSIVYLVILKPTRIRTLGYRFMHLRLVNLGGKPVSLWRSVLRFFFALIGPLNYGLDLLWIPGDPSRQALRDKFAATLVIRVSAVPIGYSRVIYRRYYFMGWTFVFEEVEGTAIFDRGPK